ncbi:MAG TPA: hypothetical protein VLQ89_00880 [Candidatus Binatia bacterium]|nr:hypothetical protein [Candidatus Binatia bacterium]
MNSDDLNGTVDCDTLSGYSFYQVIHLATGLLAEDRQLKENYN